METSETACSQPPWEGWVGWLLCAEMFFFSLAGGKSREEGGGEGSGLWTIRCSVWATPVHILHLACSRHHAVQLGKAVNSKRKTENNGTSLGALWHEELCINTHLRITQRGKCHHKESPILTVGLCAEMELCLNADIDTRAAPRSCLFAKPPMVSHSASG